MNKGSIDLTNQKTTSQKNGNLYQFSNHLARGHLAPRLRRRPHQSKKSITPCLLAGLEHR